VAGANHPRKRQFLISGHSIAGVSARKKAGGATASPDGVGTANPDARAQESGPEPEGRAANSIVDSGEKPSREELPEDGQRPPRT